MAEMAHALLRGTVEDTRRQISCWLESVGASLAKGMGATSRRLRQHSVRREEEGLA